MALGACGPRMAARGGPSPRRVIDFLPPPSPERAACCAPCMGGATADLQRVGPLAAGRYRATSRQPADRAGEGGASPGDAPGMAPTDGPPPRKRASASLPDSRPATRLPTRHSATLCKQPPPLALLGMRPTWAAIPRPVLGACSTLIPRCHHRPR